VSESLGKCVVCGKEAGALYPLLSGSPAFCSQHHNPKDAGPFGCDFTGPDDFDIPDIPLYSPEMFDRKTFVWTDRGGVKHHLADISDRYLDNIVNFLVKRISEMELLPSEYWSAVVGFLRGEQRLRGGVVVENR